MDTKTATKFVERIEAHRAGEDAIWQEMRDRDDYEMHEDKDIAEALRARKVARTKAEESEVILSAFDADLQF